MALSAGADQNQTTSRVLNKIQYAMTEIAADITTATTSDIVLMLDASDNYEPKYADSANVFELMGVTATAAEINAVADAGSRLVNVTDAATYTVLAADSGKIHIMPDFTASCTLTLPAVAAGLEYTFIGKAVAADAQNWIIKSPSATNYFLGGVSFADTDAGAGADEIHAGIWSNGSTNDFLTVVTPGAGTRIHVICDGTNWIANGQVFSATVPAFSDA
jgi:hypothetical protein